MGNTCAGPNVGHNGFLKSVTAAMWRSRPPVDRLPPPKDGTDSKSKTNASSDSSKNNDDPETSDPSNVQHTSPETVKIGNNDAHKAVEREMLSRVIKDGCKAPEGAK